MSSPPPRRKGLVLVALALIALVVSGMTLWSDDEPPAPAPAPPRQTVLDVLDGPGNTRRVQIDMTLYAPAETPAPAIMLAHGFGADKNSVSRQATELSRRGFTVLTYSARGFGNSTGRIGLNAPEYEVADARQILDWLARQPEVQRDGEGDPRVGVSGVSYGGALSLLLAGADPRVDAIAPVTTYNDLGRALRPNAASTAPLPADSPAPPSSTPGGVFKQAWASLLFSAGNLAPGVPPPSTEPADGTATGPKPPPPTTCGRFTQRTCAAYAELAQTGRAGPATRELLDAVSPKRATSRITKPTLLVQGTQDTLFGLGEADANARQISRAGGQVRMLWFAGGHDGAPPGPQQWSQIADWFAFHLGSPNGQPVDDPGTGFTYEVAEQRRSGTRTPVDRITAPAYPGVAADRTPRYSLPLHGAPTRVVNPPGGRPAATSSLPLVRHAPTADVPGQTAVFGTDPVHTPLMISGSPQTRLSVASVPGQPATGDAVLFAKVYDVGPDGQRSLATDSVAPMHLAGLPANGAPVEVNVTLPGLVHQLRPGHRLELAVSTTDQAYANLNEPAVYRVAPAGESALSVPSVRGLPVTPNPVPAAPLIGIGVIAALALLAWVVGRIRRTGTAAADVDLLDTPLSFAGLGKAYSDEDSAVRDVSLRVERGQIVGLLGPNGAGKTTALRMLLGLLRPDSGEIRVFGHLVTAGAPVLSRVGALVESPGFLPYLSGTENLHYYWASTGRPMLQARFDEVLRIAGLGDDADRRVDTYSQGMKQRLAIAQAMLGLPELLVLDEPTNGLDPPQIHQLREMLHRYAATGRSVLISSHLLAEVEQTCTHVVVMHRGTVLTSGTVPEIVAIDGEVTFRVDEPQRAAEALRALEGLGAVRTDEQLVHAELGAHEPSVAVNTLVASGVSVSQVGPRRRLEDAFLELVGEEER